MQKLSLKAGDKYFTTNGWVVTIRFSTQMVTNFLDGVVNKIEETVFIGDNGVVYSADGKFVRPYKDIFERLGYKDEIVNIANLERPVTSDMKDRADWLADGAKRIPDTETEKVDSPGLKLKVRRTYLKESRFIVKFMPTVENAAHDAVIYVGDNSQWYQSDGTIHPSNVGASDPIVSRFIDTRTKSSDKNISNVERHLAMSEELKLEVGNHYFDENNELVLINEFKLIQTLDASHLMIYVGVRADGLTLFYIENGISLPMYCSKGYVNPGNLIKEAVKDVLSGDWKPKVPEPDKTISFKVSDILKQFREADAKLQYEDVTNIDIGKLVDELFFGIVDSESSFLNEVKASLSRPLIKAAEQKNDSKTIHEAVMSALKRGNVGLYPKILDFGFLDHVNIILDGFRARADEGLEPKSAPEAETDAKPDSANDYVEKVLDSLINRWLSRLFPELEKDKKKD